MEIVKGWCLTWGISDGLMEHGSSITWETPADLPSIWRTKGDHVNCDW